MTAARPAMRRARSERRPRAIGPEALGCGRRADFRGDPRARFRRRANGAARPRELRAARSPLRLARFGRRRGRTRPLSRCARLRVATGRTRLVAARSLLVATAPARRASPRPVAIRSRTRARLPRGTDRRGSRNGRRCSGGPTCPRGSSRTGQVVVRPQRESGQPPAPFARAGSFVRRMEACPGGCARLPRRAIDSTA